MRFDRQSGSESGAATSDGLRVLVTGGTSGLGESLVRALYAAGAHVAFVARTAMHVDRLADELPGTIGIAADVAKQDDIYRIALQALGALGGLDVLVNNASALGPTPLRLLADTQCEDLEHVFATNVLGPFRLTKAVLGALAASARAGRGAVVLNISSDAASNAYAGWGAYGASKAALAHLTRIWHEELALEGVSFLAFDPGDMDTAMHAAAIPDAKRSDLKRPEVAALEIIEAVARLLGFASSPHRPVHEIPLTRATHP